MSTIDKINSELSALERDLSQLNHYTEEIGRAKDAAKNIVDVSKNFLKDFQTRIVSINNQMDIAAKEFKVKADKSAVELDNASNLFRSGIDQSKQTLDDIGLKLLVAAKGVNDLSAKIESINILSHFERIHSALSAVKSAIESSNKSNAERIKLVETTIEVRNKEISRNQLITIGILVLVALMMMMRMFSKS